MPSKTYKRKTWKCILCGGNLPPGICYAHPECKVALREIKRFLEGEEYSQTRANAEVAEKYRRRGLSVSAALRGE